MSLNIFIANHELEEFYGGIMYKPSGRLRLHTMGLLRFEFFFSGHDGTFGNYQWDIRK